MNNTHNSQLRFVSRAELRCPNCNSIDLKKVSLAYQEGLFCTVLSRMAAMAQICWLQRRPREGSSVRSVQAAKPSSEVVVPKTDSLVGGTVSLDRLDRLLHRQHYQKFFCCFVASVDPFRVVVCRHVPSVAGSVLEAQSDYLQASVLPVGTLVPLPTLWHSDGAGIGFPQRSCKAEARYVAKVLPSESRVVTTSTRW